MQKAVVVLLVEMLIVVACGTQRNMIIANYDPTQQAMNGKFVREATGESCPPPPTTFQELDLVGTWVMTAGGGSGEMTLMINKNGTYRQTYDYPPTNYHYEGEWKKWWLEYRSSGIPRLHLQEMRWCTYMCFQGSQGTWYDFCEKTIITTTNETVLLVNGSGYKGTPPPGIIIPRDIVLLHPQSDPDSLAPVFQLRP